MGNIANNAYLNAKIQRRAGIDADVASFDYYHIMGCPEWEDADFEGEVDEFYPDWSAVDLGDWERPRWFVQGPMRTCVEYLLALRDGDTRRANRLWKRLRTETWLVCRRSRAADSARFAVLLVRAARHPRATVRRLRAEFMNELGESARLSPRIARPVSLGVSKTVAAGHAIRAMAGGMPPRRALAFHVFPTRMARALTAEDRALRESADKSRSLAIPRRLASRRGASVGRRSMGQPIPFSLPASRRLPQRRRPSSVAASR